MPEAEDRRGERCQGHRSKVSVRKRYAEAGILHADFNRKALALCHVKVKEFPEQEPEGKTQRIVQHHDGKDLQARRREFGVARSDDGGENEDDRNGAYQGENGGGGLDLILQKALHDDARDDGEQHDLADGPEHGSGVDADPLIGKKINEERGDNGGEKRRAARDRHRQSHVAACEERHHVARGAARAAAHQNDAQGNVGGKPQNQAEEVRRQGHDDELTDDADQHFQGTRKDFLKVGDGKRESHAEHHNAEQNRNVGQENNKRTRGKVRKQCKEKNPEGKGFADKSADGS